MNVSKIIIRRISHSLFRVSQIRSPAALLMEKGRTELTHTSTAKHRASFMSEVANCQNEMLRAVVMSYVSEQLNVQICHYTKPRRIWKF